MNITMNEYINNNNKFIPINRLEQMRLEFDSDADHVLLELRNLNKCGKCKCIIFENEKELIDKFLIKNKNFQFECSCSNVDKISNKDSHSLKFIEKYLQVPDWVDFDKLVKGQILFLRYSTAASMGLLYYSLIGGLSAPKIIKVLDATTYLTKNQELTYKRLIETLEMVIDCIESKKCMFPGNSGWLSVLKVRFLHSKVRINLLQRKDWDTEKYGIPINQEDMMSTLLSFSINILDVMKKFYAPLSRDDEDSYLHLWRYIGFLIGVSNENNPCFSINMSRIALNSIIEHILIPDERSQQLAEHILLSVSNRKPFMWSYKKHCEAAIFLLPLQLSKGLNIKGDFKARLYIYFIFYIVSLWSFFIAPYLSYESSIFQKTKKLMRFHVNKELNKI